MNRQVCVDLRLGSGFLKARAQYVNGCGAVPAMSRTYTVSGVFECLSLGGLEPVASKLESCQSNGYKSLLFVGNNLGFRYVTFVLQLSVACHPPKLRSVAVLFPSESDPATGASFQDQSLSFHVQRIQIALASSEIGIGLKGACRNELHNQFHFIPQQIYLEYNSRSPVNAM